MKGNASLSHTLLLKAKHHLMFSLQLEYLEAEYYPDHWYHKEAAVVDPNWTWGNVTDKTVRSDNFILT